MSGLETIALAGLIGGVASAGATIYAGNETKKASREAAKRETTAGQAEFASAQREAQERKLEGALIESRQQAGAAASGGGAGADAPTITRIMTETRKRIDYGVASTMAGGRNRRQGYLDRAESTRKSGDASFLGSILTGIGQVAEAF